MKLTSSASSQAIWVRTTGGPGALLVSPFNIKWRFSALAGGVEGSKLCLYSVILPAKCVSIISLRFHFRRLAFCFLPLAAILECLIFFFFKGKSNRNSGAEEHNYQMEKSHREFHHQTQSNKRKRVTEREDRLFAIF
jgi:hypothetical protein